MPHPRRRQIRFQRILRTFFATRDNIGRRRDSTGVGRNEWTPWPVSVSVMRLRSPRAAADRVTEPRTRTRERSGMAHVATTSVVRQLGSLFEGGSAAGLSDRQLLERFVAAVRATRPPSRRWSRGTGRWCWASAGSSSATPSTPRTPSRPSSSSWPRRPARSATPSCWATGSTASRSGRRGAPRQQVARRRRREEDHAMRGPAAGSCAAAEPTAPPADRPAIDREQAEALHGEIDRLPDVLPPAGGALLLRGPHPRRGRPTPPMPGRYGPQPAGPRKREAPRSAWPAAASSCPPPRWAPSWRPGRPRRPSPPLLCDSTTRAAIAFAARHAAAAGRSPHPPRRWPRRS